MLNTPARTPVVRVAATISVPKVLSRWSPEKHAVVADLSGVFMLDAVTRNLANKRDACGHPETLVVGYTETPTHWKVYYGINRLGVLLRALPPGRGENSDAQR